MKLNTNTGKAVYVKTYSGARGSGVAGLDGDSDGMYVSAMSCVEGTEPEYYYGRPTGRMASVCSYFITKLVRRPPQRAPHLRPLVAFRRPLIPRLFEPGYVGK